MKVDFPEPVDPVSLYRFMQERDCTQKDLETMLRIVRLEIDKICASTLQGRDYTLIAYEMTIERRDREERLCFPVIGGFDLSVGAGRMYALPRFQNRYREAFQEAVNGIGDGLAPVTINIEVTGFRDKITRQVEAQDPSQ